MNRASFKPGFNRTLFKRVLLAATAAAALPLAAQAGDLSYNYVQGGYQYGHADSGHDSHGWTGNGSVAIGQNFQLLGGYTHNNRDERNNRTDGTTDAWNIGGGFHTPISDKTDFVADVDYHQANVDGISRDIKTYSGEVGVRSAMAPHLEGWAMLGYGDAHNPNTGNSHGKVHGTLGGEYKFNNSWGLVAEGRASSDNHGIFIGPRISF